MCGIAGFTQPASDAPSILEGMLERIAHRGPDGRGAYIDQNVAMGNVLLAIVDIGHGSQPVKVTRQGVDYVGVYNGEIYNHLKVRAELEKEGFVFHTNCDTEVIVAAVAFWGEEAIERFEGQWALAVWCEDTHTLLLARDPLGIKPLFVFSDGDFLGFASEPKALFSHPRIHKQPNLEAIQDYFLHGFAFAAGYSLNHRSFYKGVETIPPGHLATWSPGESLRKKQYFTYPLDDKESFKSVEDVEEDLFEAVESSIGNCMMGDAPLGVALSGGLDSSIIASVAARKHKEAGHEPLLASCIRYNGQTSNDDAAHAELLKSYLGENAPLRLVYSTLNTDTYLDDVDRMIQHFDEPHWEPKQLAMFNNYRVLKKEGAKVVMTGEGADEMFFGYYHKFPGFLNPVIDSTETFRACWSSRVPVAVDLFVGATNEALTQRMDEAISTLYTPFAPPKQSAPRAMQCWYLSTFLQWLLIDNDRCSMAFSLEGRFPFLNKRVFELALRIPPSIQLGGEYGEEKMCLRHAFRNHLPIEIWRDRKKAPLPSPDLLGFHECLVSATRKAVQESPSSLWEMLDENACKAMLDLFDNKVRRLKEAGHLSLGGREMTSYLHLNQPWDVRSPHIFGLLTLMRWWTLNFK